MSGQPVGTMQHRVPAAILGRFGKPDGRRWRQALLGVLDLQTLTRRRSPLKAGSVARDVGAYDYTDGTTADNRWIGVESRIPDAIPATVHLCRRLLDDGGEVDARTLTGDEETALGVLHTYAADITVRHAGFDEYLGAQGLTQNQRQSLRERISDRQRDEWKPGQQDVVLLYDADGRLVINDYGWVGLRGGERGALVPVDPSLAILVRIELREGYGVGVINQSDYLEQARRALIEAAAEPPSLGPRFAFFHPEDPDYLAYEVEPVHRE